MPFERRILLHGAAPGGVGLMLSPTAIRSCWFELHRQGGCGAGEVVLSDPFELRDEVDVGDWISFEPEAGVRWYLGRVEERRAESPARVRLRLEGMGVQLNEVFPGGFGAAADGRSPHRYAGTDLFSLDPDRSLETFDAASSAEEVVRLLLTQYVEPATHIAYVPARIEAPELPAPVSSLKVRGEETARALIKDLALRAQSASWGVDAAGEFFFLKRRDEVGIALREGRDLTSLAEHRDFDTLFNRILLTGDYVYDRRDQSGDVARRSYRWRGNYFEPASRAAFGERRIRIWLPWVRTRTDSIAFAKEFFRTYSQPGNKFFLETAAVSTLPLPWLQRVRVEDRSGAELITARVETVRVLFDHAPRLRMELGPEDPRNLWPEPPHDERWELPESPLPGGTVSFTDFPSDGGTSDSGDSSGFNTTSGLSSDDSSEGSDGSGASSSGGVDPSTSGPTTSDSSGDGDSSGDESTTADDDSSDDESGSDSGESSGDDSDGSGDGSNSDGESSPGDDSSGVLSSNGNGSSGHGSDGESSLTSEGSEGTDPITFVIS